MAERDLIVRIVGDETSYQRSLKKAASDTNTFGRNLGRNNSFSTAGLKAGDKFATSFTKAGRAAFVGGFAGVGAAMATESVLSAVKSSIDASKDAQLVLGQTQVALEATGRSWEDYGKQIEDTVAAQSKLGFDDEALLRTFSLFVRQSKDVGEALRRNNIAMDLARARFIDLEQAAQLVNKASLGQAGALRRVGIDAKAGASGVELLNQLEREFAGSAQRASTTAAAANDRLKVSIENVQEALGSALLPTLTNVAVALSDAADGATVLIGKLQGISDVKIPVIDIPINFKIPGTDSKVFNIGKEVLKRTNPLGQVFVAQDIANLFKDQPKPDSATAAKQFEDQFTGFLDGLEKGRKTVQKKVAKFGEEGFKPLPSSVRERQDAAAKSLLDSLSLNLKRTGLTKSLEDDNKVLAQIEAVIRKSIARGSFIEGLDEQLVDVQLRIADNQNSSRDAAKEATRSAKQASAERKKLLAERAKEAKERAAEEKRLRQEAGQAKQFRALGLDATGNKPPPAIANLKKQLGQLSSRDDLTGNQKGLLERIRKVLVDPINKATPETRDAIRGLFDTIRGTFDSESSKGPLTPGRKLDIAKFSGGLGLSGDALKELQGRLSRISPGGTMATGGAAAFGQVLPVSASAAPEVNVFIDSDKIEPKITVRQQKNAGRTSKQTRGRFGGL